MAVLLTSPPPPLSLLPKNPNPTLLLCPTNLHSLSFSLLPKTTTTARFSSPDPLSSEPLIYNFSVDEWGDLRSCPTPIRPKMKTSGAKLLLGLKSGLWTSRERESRAGRRAAKEGICRSLIRRRMQMSREVKNIMFISSNDNGSVGKEARVINGDDDDKLMELKRCLVDSVYGTDLGFRASTEVRVEVLKLINQLEGRQRIRLRYRQRPLMFLMRTGFWCNLFF